MYCILLALVIFALLSVGAILALLVFWLGLIKSIALFAVLGISAVVFAIIKP